MTQRRIPATYMRGGTSKGVFFRLQDLPGRAGAGRGARRAVAARDRQPRPVRQADRRHGRRDIEHQQDGDLSQGTRADHDVDYLFGQVAIDEPVRRLDRQLRQSVRGRGPFAIASGLVDRDRVRKGMATVRIWQANIGKTIIAHVPVANGRAVEEGRLRTRRRRLSRRPRSARIH